MVVSSIGGVLAAPQSSPVAPISSGPISIDAVPVPLNPQNPSEMAIGDFLYAGGLVLTSRQTDQLHGLSDLEVTARTGSPPLGMKVFSSTHDSSSMARDGWWASQTPASRC